MNSYRVMGFIFIIAAGLIYSLERAVSILSTSLIRAGFFSGQMSGEVPSVEASGFAANSFVPLFIVIGIILLLASFRSRR